MREGREMIERNPNSMYFYHRHYWTTPEPYWASAFTEAGFIAARLQKMVFMEMGVVRRPPPKVVYFWRWFP